MQLQLKQSLESLEGELARKILRGSHEASMQRHGGTKEGFQAYEETTTWV
jgi:hypothetical protein